MHRQSTAAVRRRHLASLAVRGLGYVRKSVPVDIELAASLKVRRCGLPFPIRREVAESINAEFGGEVFDEDDLDTLAAAQNAH